MTNKTFGDFFFEKFLEWEQNQSGRRSSYTAYAKYLSGNSFGIKISQQLVSAWIKKEFKPSEKHAPALQEKLGKEIYKYLDFPPPPKLLTYLLAKSNELTDEQIEELTALIEKYVAENEGKKNKKRGLSEATS